MEVKKIKCLVWDLDNTLWEGTLLEGGVSGLRPGIREVVEELDRRGILQSVASKNDPDPALAQLEEYGLSEYFLLPQIGWHSKAESLANLAKSLNLGLDAFAFIDDQPAEREEVAFHHPQVRCFDAADYQNLTEREEFTPRFITEDSARRREMYRQDLMRQEQEQAFSGSSDEFLKSLDMHLTIAPVASGDLERVEELTQRTNQLNSTGLTYSYEELQELISSPDHLFWVAELTDKFGSYGKIGLVLAERGSETLTIKLLLMSCRVMTRGIGSALLVHLIKTAGAEQRKLVADFVSTDRNRIMYITYKLMGFEETYRKEDRCTLEYTGEDRDYPAYLALDFE